MGCRARCCCRGHRVCPPHLDLPFTLCFMVLLPPCAQADSWQQQQQQQKLPQGLNAGFVGFGQVRRRVS